MEADTAELSSNSSRSSSPQSQRHLSNPPSPSKTPSSQTHLLQLHMQNRRDQVKIYKNLALFYI